MDLRNDASRGVENIPLSADSTVCLEDLNGFMVGEYIIEGKYSIDTARRFKLIVAGVCCSTSERLCQVKGVT